MAVQLEEWDSWHGISTWSKIGHVSPLLRVWIVVVSTLTCCHSVLSLSNSCPILPKKMVDVSRWPCLYHYAILFTFHCGWLRGVVQGRQTQEYKHTHTHIPTQSINFEHSNCLFDVCHNSHAGSGLQMVWKSVRSRNCGVDQYMHGQNFLTTGWFLASSIVYIYCSFTGEFCQLVWQIGVLFVWHWCSPKLFQNLLFKL